MTAVTALHPLIQGWLLEVPLADHVPAYVERLRRGRYAANTASKCLNCVAHFAHWASMCHIPLALLNDGCIDQFLQYHLPRCALSRWRIANAQRCARGTRTAAGDSAGGLRHCAAVRAGRARSRRTPAIRRLHERCARPGCGLATRRLAHRRTAAGCKVRRTGHRHGRTSARRTQAVHRRSVGFAADDQQCRHHRVSAALLSALPSQLRRFGAGASSRHRVPAELEPGDSAPWADADASVIHSADLEVPRQSAMVEAFVLANG